MPAADTLTSKRPLLVMPIMQYSSRRKLASIAAGMVTPFSSCMMNSSFILALISSGASSSFFTSRAAYTPTWFSSYSSMTVAFWTCTWTVLPSAPFSSPSK